MSVQLPPMRPPQRDAWWTLMDLHELMPTGWALVGGQMVHLLCAERGVSPERATDDVDAAIDVRARPRALREFTASLQRLGLRPEGTTWRGHQHRWRKDEVVVDVLIPRWLAPQSPARRTVTGATTIESPGLQQAVDRAADVGVTVMGRSGMMRRPHLLGALVAKASAMEIAIDDGHRRHLHDFVTLSTLIRPDDDIAAATKLDRRPIANMLGRLVDDVSWRTIEGGADGIERLRLALDGAPSTSPPARPPRARGSW